LYPQIIPKAITADLVDLEILYVAQNAAKQTLRSFITLLKDIETTFARNVRVYVRLVGTEIQIQMHIEQNKKNGYNHILIIAIERNYVTSMA